MPFETREQNGLVFLTSPLLSGVRHAFSTRKGGVSVPPWDSLNLGPSRGDDPAAVAENYRRFCGAVGLDEKRVVLSKQVHETTVRVCTADDAGKGLWRERGYTADALITNEPNLPLVVFSADCGILLGGWGILLSAVGFFVLLAGLNNVYQGYHHHTVKEKQD